MFLEKTSMRAAEGQYNLTEAFGLAKYNADLLVGGSTRQFILNSQGTLFADTAGNITINESGAYAQLSKRFLDDLIKFSFSGRYDKNQNFEGQYTPRFSAVLSPSQDHNIRLSYQTGFRIPTTQNQYIDLATPAGTLIGGLPEFDTRYKLATGVTRETLTAFATDVAKNGANSKFFTDAVKAAAVQYATAAVTAHKVKTITDNFYNYINTLKEQATKGYEVDPETGKLPYEEGYDPENDSFRGSAIRGAFSVIDFCEKKKTAQLLFQHSQSLNQPLSGFGFCCQLDFFHFLLTPNILMGASSPIDSHHFLCVQPLSQCTKSCTNTLLSKP